ncbi:hypothetical protein H6P81_016779 [Aristolochia fimbriata]|uniref:Uncharacterized protein n=1 Tax=Aristolochia fimbriata TaxID=158543 RepID=A0AAV7E9Y5_ARIFI|nr:hypothetical protein H6P81_016779 [Aristolochia fimbriata]
MHLSETRGPRRQLMFINAGVYLTTLPDRNTRKEKRDGRPPVPRETAPSSLQKPGKSFLRSKALNEKGCPKLRALFRMPLPLEQKKKRHHNRQPTPLSSLLSSSFGSSSFLHQNP